MRITKTTGNSSDIEFTVEDNNPITEDMAMEIQRKEGYHPAGYGFYNLRTVSNLDTFMFTATWNCRRSCD